MISLALRKSHVAALSAFVAVVALLFVADWLIVTDGERIDATVSSLRTAVEDGDAQGVMACLSDDFQNPGGLTREEIGVLAEGFFEVYGPVEFLRFRFDRNRAGNLAIVVVEALVSMDEGRAGVGRSVWELELKKESDGAWRVIDVSPRQVGGQNTDGWDALPGIRRLRSGPGRGRERERPGEQE